MKNKPITSDPEAMKELKDKIDLIVIKQLHHLSSNQLTPEAEIVKDLGADSLDCEFVLFELEDEFEIETDEADFEKLRTLGQVYQYVAEKLEESK
jgi:acyl carrier protein